jgi:hypothetical protein
MKNIIIAMLGIFLIHGVVVQSDEEQKTADITS